jgi:hypothetical protein
MKDINPVFEEFAEIFTGRIKAPTEIAFPEKLQRDALDYAFASLALVDQYLAYVHQHAAEMGESEWKPTVMRAGAYVGEVLRRASGNAWRWIDYEDYMPQHPDLQEFIPERNAATCAFLHNEKGDMRMPLSKVARFIEEGPENNVQYFVGCDLQPPGGSATPAETSRIEMESSESPDEPESPTKYRLMLRSRPRADEPIPSTHDRIMSALSKVAPPWGLVCNPWPKVEEPGGEYISSVLLENCFGETIALDAIYRNRAALRDEGMSDDAFAFDFDAAKVDYSRLLDDALPRYLEITRAYVAEVMPYEYLLQEASKMRLIQQRSAVYNIAPVNYFDAELCTRAFSLSPQQLLDKLAGKIAEGRILNGGAYIIASRQVVNADQARQLASQLRIT